MANELFIPFAWGANSAEIQQFLLHANWGGVVWVRLEEAGMLGRFRSITKIDWKLDGQQRTTQSIAEAVSRSILAEYAGNPGSRYRGARITVRQTGVKRPAPG